MAISTAIPQFTVTPLRTNPATFSEDTDTYHSELANFISKCENWRTEANSTATTINSNATSASQSEVNANNSALIAQGSANYKGDYIAGSYGVGDSVTYNGVDYISKENNNTDIPTTSKWKVAGFANAMDERDKSLFKAIWNNSIRPEKSVNPDTDVTFTRATTAEGETRRNLLETYAVNEPRLNQKGILIEEQSENLCLDNNDFTTANWSRTNITITPNYAYSPDGTLSASRIQGVGISALLQTETSLLGVDSSMSIWVKSNGNGKDTFRLIGAGLAGGNIVATNDWVRHSIQFLGDGTDSNGIIRDSSSNDFDLLIYKQQVEGLPFPTSNTIDTRAYDSLLITSKDNFPSNKEGTVSIEFEAIGIKDASYILGVYQSPTNSFRILVSSLGGLSFLAYSSDGTTNISENTLVELNKKYKVIVTWKNNVLKMYKKLDNVLTLVGSTTWDGNLFDDLSSTHISIGSYIENTNTLRLNGYYSMLETKDYAISPSAM